MSGFRMSTQHVDGIVAVVGGGYMGGGIAQSFAAKGIDCVLIDATPERSREAVKRLHGEAQRFTAAGLMSEQARDAVVEHLSPATSLEAGVAQASYVSE